MRIVDKVFVELPCPRCGRRHEVPLASAFASHEQRHESCPVSDLRKCAQLEWSTLVRETVHEFEDASEQIERSMGQPL